MRKKVKVFVALLACMLCLLSACGKAEEESASGEEPDIRQNTQQNQTGGSGEQQDVGNDVQEMQEYVQPEMKGEITISCLSENEFLTAAAKQFMDRYPDVTITINASEAGTVEDYQTYLNTKIMGGKAEDIIFNSFLPITRYSEMGVFEDLSGYISITPEFNDENFFMNVLQAARQDSGEIYVIPYMARFDVIGFSDSLLAGQADIRNTLETWEVAGFSESMDLARQLVAGTDKRNVFLIHSNELSYANSLIQDFLGQFVDVEGKKVNLDSAEYIDLLNSVKELSNNNSFGSGISFYNEDYYFAVSKDYDVQAAYYCLAKDSDQAYGVPLGDAEGNVVINANNCIALNSASDHKDLAWEFIRYLLWSEVQALPSLHGLAVNRQGFEASVARYYTFYENGNNSGVDEAEYGALLESWMEQINSCDLVDAVIWDLFNAENEKFFSGTQTAEQTAKNLQKQIDQYFNE